MRSTFRHRALLALVFVGLLSACGGGGGEPDPVLPGPSGPEPGPVVPEPPKPIVPTAYMLESGRITGCTLTESGPFSECKDSGAQVEDSEAIAFKGSFAYIVQSSGPTVKRCSVDAAGSMSACVDAGLAGVGEAYAVQVDGSRLYVMAGNAPLVHVCDIQDDGTLSACRDAGFAEPVTFPQHMAIQDGRGYLLGLDGPLFRCRVNVDGSWSNCEDASVGVSISSAYGFALDGGRAYIGNGSGVLLCEVSAEGFLENCRAAVEGSQDFQAGSVVVDGANFYGAAVSTGVEVAVTRCSIGADGMLSACVDTGFIPPNGNGFMPASVGVRR